MPEGGFDMYAAAIAKKGAAHQAVLVDVGDCVMIPVIFTDIPERIVVVNGYSETAFGPADPITREQLAAILYRYAKYQDKDVKASASLDSFSDAASVSSYALDAMRWACGMKLINGANGKLDPTGLATRAQVAAILQRYCENVE